MPFWRDWERERERREIVFLQFGKVVRVIGDYIVVIMLIFANVCVCASVTRCKLDPAPWIFHSFWYCYRPVGGFSTSANDFNKHAAHTLCCCCSARLAFSSSFPSNYIFLATMMEIIYIYTFCAVLRNCHLRWLSLSLHFLCAKKPFCWVSSLPPRQPMLTNMIISFC